MGSNFYPRPPRGGRLSYNSAEALANRISIHALREEGDLAELQKTAQDDKISIHALREEGDGTGKQQRTRSEPFLSTPSARRATPTLSQEWMAEGNFYPRPPRGGRRCHQKNTRCRKSISIHALREEGDDTFNVDTSAIIHFYPRPPRGGRRHHQAR